MYGAIPWTSHCSMHARVRRSHERGSALLVALALLALGAALLAGSAQAGRSASRSAQSHVAAITADAEARTALADFVGGWSGSSDSIEVGTGREASVAPHRVGLAGLMASARIRVLRVSSSHFVIGVEVTVGPAGVVAARRRMCLIIERQSPADSTATEPQAPQRIARWSAADLF